MGLIKCKECGKEISDKAQKCPHCGAITVHEAKKTIWIAVFTIIGFIVIALLLRPTCDLFSY